MVLYMSSQREIQKQNKISCETAKNAGVAQLVEQLICNQQVGGSSPSTSSKLPLQRTSEYGGIPEWPKGADCKSVVSDFGGSNPPSPTKKIVTPYGVTIFFLKGGRIRLPRRSPRRFSASILSRRTAHRKASRSQVNGNCRFILSSFL